MFLRIGHTGTDIPWETVTTCLNVGGLFAGNDWSCKSCTETTGTHPYCTWKAMCKTQVQIGCFIDGLQSEAQDNKVLNSYVSGCRTWMDGQLMDSKAEAFGVFIISLCILWGVFQWGIQFVDFHVDSSRRKDQMPSADPEGNDFMKCSENGKVLYCKGKRWLTDRVCAQACWKLFFLHTSHLITVLALSHIHFCGVLLLIWIYLEFRLIWYVSFWKPQISTFRKKKLQKLF